MAKIVADIKKAVGKVYFSNGDIEEITNYIIYTDDNIVFYTKTGRYAYRKCFEDMMGCGRCIMTLPRSRFYKSRVTVESYFSDHFQPRYDDEWFVVEIDRIELEEVE